MDNGTERRAHPRFALGGSLGGELKDERGQVLTHVLVDVSRSGLGVVVDCPLECGACLTLNTPHTENPVALEVRWVNQTGQSPVAYRIGLAVTDSTDMVELADQIDTALLELV